MSNKSEQKMSEEKKGVINLSDLPRREEELTDKEAEEITGGGGAYGGVLKSGLKSSSEEFSQ